MPLIKISFRGKWGFPFLDDLEIVLASFRASGRNILAGCAYLPPNLPADKKAEFYSGISRLSEIASSYDLCFFTGDFNIPFNFNVMPSSLKSLDCVRLTEAFEFLGCEQVVCSPTRLNNLLDLVFLSEKRFINKLAIVDNLPGTDHSAIEFSLKIHKKYSQSILFEVFKYSEADIPHLSRLWRAIPWSLLLSFNDVEAAWSECLDLFWGGIRDAVPSFFLRGRKRDPWISGRMIHMANKKRFLFKKYLRTKSVDSHKNYKKICNDLRTITRIAYNDYVANLHSKIKTNPKRFWTLCRSRSKIPPPTSFTCLVDRNVVNVSDPLVIANHFGEFFTSLPKPLALKGQLSICMPPPVPCNSPFVITEAEVIKNIKTLSSSMSAGSDRLTSAMLKLAPEAIAPGLAALFNISIRNASIPGEWKCGYVVLVFKNKGDRNLISNYRPITILA